MSFDATPLSICKADTSTRALLGSIDPMRRMKDGDEKKSAGDLDGALAEYIW